MHASTSLVLAMLKLVLEMSFYEGVLHRKMMVLQAIHGLNLRLVSPRSHLGTSLLPGLYDQLSVGTKPLFSCVMVFTVTDLGGVFHLRTVGRSKDMYSGCTIAFNCVRCTLPEKSSDPCSSGSDFAFCFWLFILQACSCPFRASLQLTFRAHVLYCCFSATPFSVVSA